MTQTLSCKAVLPKLKAAALSLAMLLVLGVPQMGFAEAPEEVKADQVVITATKTEKKLKEVPTSIDVVTEKEIEDNPQQTVADLLKDIPGVQVQDQSVAGVKRVVIRGESPARVLVLVDGQKISEQKSMDGAAILVDSSDIERIEVIKGPSSVLHGSEAIGGVVNIITKKGGKRTIQASQRTTFDGSNNAITGYGSVFGSKNNFSYRLSASYTDADNLYSAEGEEKNSEYMTRNMSGYLGYDWKDASLSLKWEDYWSNSNIPTAVDEGTTVELDLPKWERTKYGLFFHKKNINDILAKVSVDGYYQSTYKDFLNTVDPPGPVSIFLNTKNDQDTWGTNGQLEWTLGESHYVITGASVNLDKLKAEQQKVMSFPPPGSDSTYINKAKQDTYAIYIQDEWNVVQNWMLTIGLRQTFVESELTSTEDPDLEEGSSSNSHPVGSLGVVYSGIKNWRLRANFSQGYRMPNLQQLYIGTAHGSSSPTYANPDLDAETSNNFEVGARFSDGAWNLDTGVFYNLAEDYITTENVTGGERYVNADKATAMGVEMLLSYKFAEWNITPYANATFLRRKFDNGDETTWQTGDPNFSGRYGLRHEQELRENLLFDMDVYSRFAADAKQDNDTDHAWETYNMSMGLHYGKERKTHVTLNFNNLTNRSYTEANNALPGAGFNAVLQIGFDL